MISTREGKRGRPRPPHTAGQSPRRRVVAGILPALVSALVLPVPLVAQDGQEPLALIGTIYDSTSAGPLQGGAVYIAGTSHVTMTNREGGFVLPGVEGGTYTLSIRHARLDTLGIEAAPEWRISVAEEGITRVALAVPSISTLMPGLCDADAGSGGVVLGVVRDAATGTPLPDAVVELEFDTLTWSVESDREGRFVKCGLPTGRAIRTQAAFYRRAPVARDVRLQPGQVSFQIFDLGLSAGVEVLGQVVDLSTGEPIDGAQVRIEPPAGQALLAFTDAEGRFELSGVPLDTYIVEVEHLAYGRQTRWFTVDDVEPIELELGVVPDAIELDALVVTVSTPEVERAGRSGVRTDFIGPLEIDALLGSAQNVGDLLRTLPAVRVSNTMNPVTGQPELCVESRRSYGAGCDPVTLIMDGIRTDAEMLQQIPPHMIESIEFLPASIAGIQYGARTGSGVLLVTTRSR